MNKFLFSLVFFFSFTLYADPTDTYLVHKVGSSPIIDGELSDWEGVSAVSFTVHTDGSAGSTSGIGKAVWDSEAIYFAFEINDSDVKSNYTDQDDNLFNNDDLIEIFLDFDGDQKHYLELGVSAGNVNYDMTVCPSVSCGTWGGSSIWDITGLETAVTVSGTLNNSLDVDEGYIVEVKIPFSGLTSAPEANFSVPNVGTVWKGNLYNIDYNTGAGIDAANDYLSWSTLSSFGFHKPSEFASFQFADGGTGVNDLKDELRVVLKNDNQWEITTSTESAVNVFDLAGRRVISSSLTGRNLLNLSFLKQGVYIITIEGDYSITSEKIFVK